MLLFYPTPAIHTFDYQITQNTLEIYSFKYSILFNFLVGPLLFLREVFTIIGT
jgi:hypothetical protein